MIEDARQDVAAAAGTARTLNQPIAKTGYYRAIEGIQENIIGDAIFR